MKAHWHGTLGGYTNHRCRCTACRAAHNAYAKAVRRGERVVESPRWRHGTLTGYGLHACRCEPCRTAWSVYYKPRTAARRTARRAAGLCVDCAAKTRDGKAQCPYHLEVFAAYLQLRREAARSAA